MKRMLLFVLLVALSVSGCLQPEADNNKKTAEDTFSTVSIIKYYDG